MKKILFTLFSLSLINSIPVYAKEKVLSGLDVLEKNNFSQLKNKKVGLITNQSAYDNNGNYILDIFSKQKEFQVKAIFTPEHGLRGKEDKEFIPSETYGKNIPVYSLYGETKKPTPKMLTDIDVLIYDIQDVGTRFYTFITTMAYCIEVAEKYKIPVVILDRPVMVQGEIIEGEILKPEYKSFTGYFEVATRYAMTSGEVAKYFIGENKLKVSLQVIKLENWKRNLWFDETGLKWVNPSPNIRSLNSAILYSGFGVLETLNLSVGRGSEKPFEYYGAPWLENKKIVAELNKKNFEGLTFKEINFVPEASIYQKENVKGIQVLITDRNKTKSTEAMLYLIELINKYNPEKLKANGNNGIKRSFGSELLLDLVENKTSVEKVSSELKKHQQIFLKTREKYLLY